MNEWGHGKDYIKQHNEKALTTSIYNFYEAEEVVSIMINHGPQGLRNPSAKHPKGRQPNRFAQFLGNRVAVVGRSAFGVSRNSAARTKPEEDKKVAAKVNNHIEEVKEFLELVDS